MKNNLRYLIIITLSLFLFSCKSQIADIKNPTIYNPKYKHTIKVPGKKDVLSKKIFRLVSYNMSKYNFILSQPRENMLTGVHYGSHNGKDRYKANVDFTIADDAVEINFHDTKIISSNTDTIKTKAENNAIINKFKAITTELEKDLKSGEW